MRLLSLFFIVTVLVLWLGGPFGAVTANGADLAGTLVVRVQGLKSDEGTLRFVLFDSKEDFLKSPVRAETVEIRDQQGTWIIEQLPYGTYAVLVHHDINASGTIEQHWYGKPKEPTGASNDPPSRFGRPKFENVKFRFATTALTLTVTVK